VRNGLSDERVWIGHGRVHIRAGMDGKSTRRQPGFCVLTPPPENTVSAGSSSFGYVIFYAGNILSPCGRATLPARQ
jgi:hypothetical protein